PRNWLDHWFSVTRSRTGMGEVLTFTAPGSPKSVSRAIEEVARNQGQVAALVVPWESDARGLSMSVTAIKSDGWAIEHTNLGTIRLVEAAPGHTEVAAAAELAENPEQKGLHDVFDRFIRQLQSRLPGAST